MGAHGSIAAEADWLYDRESIDSQRSVDDALAAAAFDMARYSGNAAGAQAASI